MRMGQGVRIGLGHGGITCVLQTQFSSVFFLQNISPIDNEPVIFQQEPAAGTTAL